MRFSARRTVYVDLATGIAAFDHGGRKTIAKSVTLVKLIAALPDNTERIVLVGPLVGGSGEAHRKWATARMSDEYDEKGSYESMPNPLYLYRHRATGRNIEIRRVTEWLGEQSETDPYSATEARDTLGVVVTRLRAKFGEGATLLGSPTVTGRALLEAKLPSTYPIPLLSDEHREMFRAHTTQHRREVAPVESMSTLPEFAYLDGRFMYAALLRNVGVGPATLEYRGLFNPHARGIWHVRFTIPSNWAHVGLLSVVTDAGIVWPSAPGTSWDTWAETAEIKLAIENGWGIEHKESLLLDNPKADPLKAWRDSLVAIRDDIRADETLSPKISDLASGVVRDLLLHAVGSFASNGTREQTRRVTLAEIPAGTAAESVGNGLYKITEQVTRSATQAKWEHPEWTSKIWAESRVRILSWPPRPSANSKRVGSLDEWTPTGALHVPRENVLGFYGDAVYLTRDPQWHDDNANGRLRLKGRAEGPLPVPHTEADIQALVKLTGGEK